MIDGRWREWVWATVLAVPVLLAAPGGPAVAAPFLQFLETLWPEAQRLGVTRKTFDAATRGLMPNLALPDLVVDGRKERPAPQPEFVQTPSDYLREDSIARLAARGRTLAKEHAKTLSAIEQRFGTPPSVVLAIWGRETAFSSFRLPHNAIGVLATQAYAGRRSDMFRHEFLMALRIVEDGLVAPADMRSSWAGAMGPMQFLPSDYYRHGVDFDGDGRVDIWRSIPDALASGANQLAAKGWQRGRRWAHEVTAPKGADCTVAKPEHQLPVAEWVRRGFRPTYGRTLTAEELAEPASLLMPEGIYGPAFLTPKNYFVIKDYNFSDLYVLFVGQLADRIAGGKPFQTPWSQSRQLRTGQVETMQRILADGGYYRDKIDGKAGMLTRSAVGAYQKANGLKPDCWPTPALLDHMHKRTGDRR